MKNNFDELIDRHHNYSYKWDCDEKILPMWVADMDFHSPDFVKEALNSQVNHQIYGYSTLPDEFYLAYQRWHNDRYDCGYEIKDMIFSTGVVAAISSIIRSVTTENAQILVIEPVYNIFYNSIRNNHRGILSSSLIKKDDDYEINWQDLEEKIASPKCELLIFCNPHNPVGKLWSKEDIEKVAHLCHKYQVYVISDEIHCDFTNPNLIYNSFHKYGKEAINEMIICHSPSKTFNVAGLHGACVIVPNKKLNYKVWRGINTDEVGEPNILVVASHIAAYTKGEIYVKELNEYIYQNQLYFVNEIQKRLPHLKTYVPKSTYLMWVDVSYYVDKYFENINDFCEKLKNIGHLWVQSGLIFGESGKDYIRVNLATPKINVTEGIKRLEAFLKQYE